MTLDELLRKPGAWLAVGEEPDVVVSSRIRLARNLAGAAFPGWAGEAECVRIHERLTECLRGLPSMAGPLLLPMAELDPVTRDVLRERHLVSNELTQKGRGSGLALRSDEALSVMINEEDHLRLQAMRPGLQLARLWHESDVLDGEIERHVEYAFSPTLGYLTACPSNVGTGLRASVMLHVPGLRLTRELEPIIKGLNKIGLAVRGLLGEGTEACGNMFQISNQMTLGESEEAIVSRLTGIVTEVAAHERNARLRLLERRPSLVRDFVGRALGVLSHAHVLSSEEALDLLSALRLGTELDIINGLRLGELSRLMLVTQPGHLQKLLGRSTSPEERDEARARILRDSVRAAVEG